MTMTAIITGLFAGFGVCIGLIPLALLIRNKNHNKFDKQHEQLLEEWKIRNFLHEQELTALRDLVEVAMRFKN